MSLNHKGNIYFIWICCPEELPFFNMAQERSKFRKRSSLQCKLLCHSEPMHQQIPWCLEHLWQIEILFQFLACSNWRITASIFRFWNKSMSSLADSYSFKVASGLWLAWILAHGLPSYHVIQAAHPEWIFPDPATHVIMHARNSQLSNESHICNSEFKKILAVVSKHPSSQSTYSCCTASKLHLCPYVSYD